MPKGPKGEKRPAEVIGNSVRVMQIATGEAEEEFARRRTAGVRPPSSWAAVAVPPAPRSSPRSSARRSQGRRRPNGAKIITSA